MTTVGSVVVATGAEASNRRRLIDVVDELARPINVEDSTVRALAADAFRAAVHTMNRKGLWPWELQNEEISLTNGARFNTVSGAIKKPLSMHYLNQPGGLETQRIGYMTYDRFMEKYNIDLQGQPYVYTYPNLFETAQIMWFPIPSGNYTARFNYYRVTPAPRNEQEALEIPDHAIDAYMSVAWYEFLKRLPSQQQPYPIAVALGEMRLAFRELSAHVNTPGDRSRELDVIHG